MKKSFAALLFGFLCCAFPTESRATHYALCVGINKYSLSGCSTLSGCVNDATYFRNNLVERGDWQSADITLLTNSNATKTRIRNAITGYAATAVAGDTFVYQHSSHGGQNSGKSVFLCAYNDYYEDTELASDLAQFPSGVKVVVIVDACHSGGLFKSKEAAKAAAASFDLAGRVSAAIDAIRADETARGIKAAKLSANEIGWVTAAEYNESSLDGGYYDSDKWLTNGQDGNVMGGVFLGAFTWAWWNGSCDTKSGYGDNDCYADAYECWAVAYDCCTSSSLWGSDAFTPQYLNENVLRSVELGWVGDEEPSGVRFAPIPAQTATVGVPLSYTLVATNATGIAGSIAYSVVSATAPANTYSLNGSAFTFTPAADGAFSFTFLATNATAGACSRATMSVTASLAAPTGLENSGITATSFTANWDGVSGATSYELDVASTAFGSRAAGDNVLLEEDFAGFEGTAADRSSSLDDYLTGTGWTGSKVFENSGSAKLGSGSYAGWIATPELDLSSGGTVSFDLTQYGTSGDGNTVSVSIVSGDDETSIGTLTPGATETVELTIPAASAATSVKIATSAKRAIIDNLVITGGSSADILAGQSVSGTSFTVSDLIAGTYYWRVRAVGNAKGPYSETQEVTLVADPSAPPSIRPIDDIAVTVGETVDLAVHASAPAEAPITSLTLTEGDDIATLSADGAFSFTPAAPGTYSFTITAVNPNGSANESFTVTATLAEPTAPEATSVGHNSFTASWTAVPGATSYELVVIEGAGSGDSGDSGDSGNSNGPFVLVDTADGLVAGEYVILAENADRAMNNTCSGTSSGYLSYEEVTVDSSSISTDDASIIWTLAGNASSCTLYNADAGKYANPSTSKATVGWSDNASGAWTLSMSSGIVTARNAADSLWMLQYNSSSPRFACYSSAQKKLRFFRRGTRSLPRAVGDVVFTNNVGSVTSYTVTGLNPLTDYTFAIRALAGGEATEWTDFASVTTADAPAAPAWSEIPAMTASVGQPFRVDLAPYVSGVPTPTLTLTSGSGTLTGSFLEFTPASAGSTTFTVSAANASGNAAATFSITAAVHEPVQYAVCVGINEYADISGLEGCVNDSVVMASNLVERGGWLPANVTRLNDSAATKAAIRGAIASVAAKAQAGDTFVYQHSSHGGQFNATEDDEDPLTGEDGKDTFLCVYDEDYYDNTTAYNDYEIAADLAAFPAGVKVVVIVDACHSGGLFKSKAAAKAAAASFDLAGRVTALMDADRARRRARGEDVARTLSSSEIGWATAAEYYEYSYDGGFYHTDEWLTDASYGDEYYDEYTQDYDYPASYKVGGVFLSSATWNWWNGDADSDAEAGDNDGLCDAYEFWKKGYDFCSVIGEFWYDDSGYNYFPQCANIDVLKSVELGWVVDPRPAAPTNAVASGVTSSSFTATWSAVSNAVSYLLHVQKKVSDGSRAADSVTLLSESFENGEIPSGWTASNGVGIASGKGGDGTYCVKFTASGASLVTPALENPDSVSFQYKRSSNTASWFLDVFVGPSATGPWTSLGTVSDAGTAWQTFSSPISASGTAYLKFADARSTGTAERYIDLVVVTGSSGTWEDVTGYAPLAVNGTSQEVTGLDASTDYRFFVRSVDSNGLEGVASERTVVHTEDADSAPVWNTLPTLTGMVGEDIEFTATNYVTAVPAAVITLESSTADSGDYEFEDGYLLFAPTEADTFTFTFLASNTIGTATATLTVLATNAPVTVPTLTVPSVSSSAALAVWTACDGVSSYTLQLSTNDFSAASSGDGTAILSESFENDIPADWQSSHVATVTGKDGDGSTCVAFKAKNAYLITEAVDNPGEVSFIYKRSGNTTAWSLDVSVANSTDGPWTSIGSVSDASTTWNTFSNSIPLTGTVYIKFTDTRASGAHERYIDLVTVTGGTPSDPDDTQEFTVSDTSYRFTELETGTQYYVRVKGDDDWSNVVTFTPIDTGSAPYAPYWFPLPATNVTVGTEIELDLANYVYSDPPHVLTLSTAVDSSLYEFEDGLFLFQPDAVGTYAFTFTAANAEGSNSATFTVTVSGTAPSDTAPSWAANFPATATVTAGEYYEFPNVSAYASGSPSPIVALTSADSADCDYDDDTFLFNTATPGAYEFVFTASNVLGTATATLTVTVTAVPVTVPTLIVTNVTDTTAHASWTACDGVSSYTLQLATDDQFTAGSTGSVTLFSNDGTDATSPPTGWTYNLSDKTSAYLLMFSGHSVVSEAVDASACTDLSVSLYIRTYGGTSQPNLAIQYSTDNGSTWTDAGTVSAANTTMAKRTLDLPADAASSTLRLRFAPTTTSSSIGVGIKTIVLTGTEHVAGSLVRSETVSETSYDFAGLTPDTVYYARVKGDSDWSNVAEFTTVTTIASAPVLAVPQDSYSVLVGAPDISFAVTATGTPAPTVTATCTEGTYFVFEDNEFLFEPDTVGTYHFVFTATNSEGSDSKTVTVTVSAAPVTVPTLTVTNVTATTADASWTACDNVSSYTLQLASDDQFTTGGSGAGETLTETFANITFSPGGSGYIDQTISGGDLGTWTATSSRGDQGSPVIRYAGTLTSPTIANGVAAVEFDYDWPYSESGSCDIELYVGGTSVGSATVSASASGTATYTLDSPVVGPTTIEFLNKASSNKRIRVNEVRITAPSSGSSGGSLIDEYTVSDTSYGFTGLSPETTYYARVKGDDDWSDVEEFTTEPVGNSAPVWSSLPAQTVNVGEPLEFDLAPYVTGSPVPVILLGDTEFVAEMQGSTFVFDPSSSGDYTFSFTASNEVGTADATLSVTAVSEAPELTITPDTSFSVTVGDTVEFSVIATGIPAPAVSVSTMATVSYSFENGAFRFEANDPGLYEFEFSAENVVGTDTLTVTVEVLATVPTLTVSNVTATTAFASWNNCANVLEYTLQLSTNEYFTVTGGAGAGSFTEDFTGFTSTSYTDVDTSQTVTSGTWSYEFVMFKPTESANGDGSVGCAQLKANTGRLYLPVVNSPSTISITASTSIDGGTMSLEQQVNGSWEPLGSWTLTSTGAQYTHTFTDAAGSTALRLCANSRRVVYIHDIAVTGADSGSVSDGTGTFQVLEGSGTSSYTFTDLLPDTTYWARVKGNSDWSEPVSFHTLAAPANLVEALGLPVWVTDDQIVCRITAFSYADATGAAGTFAVTAEDEGILLAESSTMATNVQFSVLGAATLGNFAPLDATECGVELTSRTAPYGFRVSHPGTNLFFRVQLETGNN